MAVTIHDNPSPRDGLFTSFVCVVGDDAETLEPTLCGIAEQLEELCEDFELIVVDNASRDTSLVVLQRLAETGAVANLQVYALTAQVSRDTAIWLGTERAIGDVCVAFDPYADDLSVLPMMLRKAAAGADVVFAVNQARAKEKPGYRIARSTFEWLMRRLNGVDLSRDAPAYRLLSRRVVAFIAQEPEPASAYRLLPATGGLIKERVIYDSPLRASNHDGFWTGLDRGLQLLVSGNRRPLRLASAFTLTGALCSLVYSAYVVVLSIARNNLEPGWVSLSLVMSTMFFLLSMALFVLGEYIIQVTTLAGGGSRTHISREFASTRMLIRERVNVEESHTKRAS